MDIDQIRDVITFALETLRKEDVRVVPLGNRVHLYVGDQEFESVVMTLDPRGSSRLDKTRPKP